MSLAHNPLELPGPDCMVSCVLSLLSQNKTDLAISAACLAADKASGASFFELNALAAALLIKNGAYEAGFEQWDKIARAAPHKLEWLEKALCVALEYADREAVAKKFAQRWQEMLSRIYTATPTVALLKLLNQQGWIGKGSLGIQSGYLKGWLWLAPDKLPKLDIKPDLGKTFSLNLEPIAKSENILYRVNQPLPQCKNAYRIEIKDDKGEHITGSPLICWPAEAINSKRKQKPEDKTAIIIPVYGDYEATLACVASVLASKRKNITKFQIYAIWDHGPDQKLLDRLQKMQARGQLKVICNPCNLGFLGSVNNALSQIREGPVILLNADTLCQGDWIDRLMAASKKPDCATMTALGNEAELMSFPDPMNRGKIQKQGQVRAIDTAARQLDPEKAVIEIPVGVGFCMLITAQALQKIGGLDGYNLFRGYGEEVDFCLRAKAAGLKNYGAFNVFIGHLGERSFGVAKKALAAQNNEAIFTTFPDYRREYEVFLVRPDCQKLREEITLNALINVKNIKELEIRPWGQRSLPPWAKDEYFKPSGKRAALFIKPGPYPRALLRARCDIPLADLNFELPDDIAKLAKAIRDLGCLKIAYYSCPDSIKTIFASIMPGVAPEEKPSRPIQPFSEEIDFSGNVIATPPSGLAGLKALKKLASMNPGADFYVSEIDSLWKGAILPSNIHAMPMIRSYNAINPRAFILANASDDSEAWRNWLENHDCEGLPFYRLGLNV